MATGGSKTQTTTTNSDPWKPAWPGLQQVMGSALDVFNSEPPQYYNGDTVANMNPTQMAGINGVNANAAYAAPLATDGTNTLNNIMGGGALKQFTSGQPNPYLGDLYKQGSRDIVNDVNAQFSQAGRYGSGAQTDVLGDRLGDMWTNLASGAYESDRNRALTAASQMDSNKLAATDRLQGMYDLRQAGAKDKIGAGSLLQDQQQREINALKDRWDYNQNARRDSVEWLSSIMNPFLGNGSQTTTGQNPNYRSAGENLMNLGATLGSAWLMSDRRVKTDIEPLGADEFGLNWYRYRYVWDAIGTERVGVMADEAPAHAVSNDAHGFACVNYGAL